jgi:hypothetical protein
VWLGKNKFYSKICITSFSREEFFFFWVLFCILTIPFNMFINDLLNQLEDDSIKGLQWSADGRCINLIDYQGLLITPKSFSSQLVNYGFKRIGNLSANSICTAYHPNFFKGMTLTKQSVYKWKREGESKTCTRKRTVLDSDTETEAESEDDSSEDNGASAAKKRAKVDIMPFTDTTASILRFLFALATTSPSNVQIPVSPLYERYVTWCADSKSKEYQLTKQRFCSVVKRVYEEGLTHGQEAGLTRSKEVYTIEPLKLKAFILSLDAKNTQQLKENGTIAEAVASPKAAVPSATPSPGVATQQVQPLTAEALEQQYILDEIVRFASLKDASVSFKINMIRRLVN